MFQASQDVDGNSRNPKAVVAVKKVEPLKPEHEKLLLTTTLPFQMVLFYHYYFLFFYYVGTVGSYWYKSERFSYPELVLSWEISTLCFHFFIEVVRLYLGNKGNKTNRRSMLLVFIVLSIPLIVGNVFFYESQTYVHKFDSILNVGSMIFLCIETVLALLSIGAFKQIKDERG